jgi:hypothetical protein
MRSKGITQTSASSSAIASQVWMVVDDAVQPDDLAGHLEAGDLVAAVLGGDAGLEEAGADGVQAGEPVSPLRNSGCAALDLAPVGHQVVDAVEFFRAQAHRHAQLAQVAVGAGTLMICC